MDDCPAGTTLTSPGTAVTGPLCDACEKGQYCMGGNSPAVVCDNQTWDHDGDPAPQCTPWSPCLPGTYVASAGNATSNQSCQPCPARTFSDLTNRSACTPWSDCQPGTYVGAPGNLQSDRVCAECSPNAFSANIIQGSCTPWTPCPAKTTFTSSPGTSTSDVACSPCSTRGCASFCTAEGTCIECTSYTDCTAGLACVNGACKDLGCGGGSYFEESFASANANWWRLEGDWDIGPAAAWSGPLPGGETYEDPITDHSSGNDNMLAGVVIGGAVATTIMDKPAYLTSPAIDISQGPSPVYLEFYRWLNSDVPPFMNNTIEVFDGSMWVPLWSGPPAPGDPLAENAWSWQVFDITEYRNEDFRVRFGYQVLDETAYFVGSWNIDDVRIANNLSCTE